MGVKYLKSRGWFVERPRLRFAGWRVYPRNLWVGVEVYPYRQEREDGIYRSILLTVHLLPFLGFAVQITWTQPYRVATWAYVCERGQCHRRSATDLSRVHCYPHEVPYKKCPKSLEWY